MPEMNVKLGNNDLRKWDTITLGGGINAVIIRVIDMDNYSKTVRIKRIPDFRFKIFRDQMV